MSLSQVELFQLARIGFGAANAKVTWPEIEERIRVALVGRSDCVVSLFLHTVAIYFRHHGRAQIEYNARISAHVFGKLFGVPLCLTDSNAEFGDCNCLTRNESYFRIEAI